MNPTKYLLPCAILVALTACTTLPESSDSVRTDRATYADFEAAFANTAQLALHRYRSVMIEPFALDGERAKAAGDSAAELQQALIAAIEPGTLVTTASGPGVLRLEVVITDIDPSSPALNVVSSLLAFVPFDTGGIAADIHLRDGESGALLATVHANEKATPLRLSGSFSRYGHAKGIVQKWGHELATLLTPDGSAASCARSTRRDSCASAPSDAPATRRTASTRRS